jgi:hypothetical protein
MLLEVIPLSSPVDWPAAQRKNHVHLRVLVEICEVEADLCPGFLHETARVLMSYQMFRVCRFDKSLAVMYRDTRTVCERSFDSSMSMKTATLNKHTHTLYPSRCR